MKHRHLLLSIAMVPALASSVNAATTLNTTTFNTGSPNFETTVDGNIGGGPGIGFKDQDNTSNTFDTINGWTWGNDVAGFGLSGGPAQGGVFAGLGGLNGGIRDSELTSNILEAGRINFGYGNSAHQTALAQGFSVTAGQTITVNYDMFNSGGGMFLYIDNGSGTYVKNHTMTNTATGEYSFFATGSNIRIAVRANDGADSNSYLNSISVTSVPEPSAALLGGLGLLGLLRRRR